jgi:WD40 repeat protein
MPPKILRGQFRLSLLLAVVAAEAVVLAVVATQIRPRPRSVGSRGLDRARPIALAPDEQSFAVAGWRRGPSHFPAVPVVDLFGVNSASLPREFDASSTGEFVSLKYSADGRVLFACKAAGLDLFDPSAGRWIGWSGASAKDWYYTTAVSADGAILASSCAGGIRVCDVATSRELMVLSERPCSLMAFSPDGRFLACGRGPNDGGGGAIWELATRQRRGAMGGGFHSSWEFAFAPDNKILASPGGPGELGTIKLWTVPTGRLLKAITAYTDRAEKVVFSPDGKRLASIGSDHIDGDIYVRFFDVPTGVLRKSLSSRDFEWSDAPFFSADGRRLIVASQEGEVLFLRTP